MNKKDLEAFYESVSLTDEQSERVFNKITEGGGKMKISKKKISLILAAAFVLVIGSLTVMAATFNWHEKLVSYLNPTEEQMQRLEPSLNAPMATVSDNGVTVTVLNTLADKHGIYALYEVTLPEDIKLTEEILEKDLNWQYYHLYFDSQKADKTLIGGFGSNDILEFDENKITMLAYFSTNGGAIGEKQKISFEAYDLTYYTWDENDNCTAHTFAECDISLTWDFTYVDTTRTFDINQQIHIADGKYNVLKSIEVSPISLLVLVEGDDVLTGIKPLITFKDGSSIEVTSPDRNSRYAFSSLMDDNPGGLMSVSYNFIPIINVEDVESIRVGDLVVPIN